MSPAPLDPGESVAAVWSHEQAGVTRLQTGRLRSWLGLLVKMTAIALAMVFVAAPAATACVEARLTRREELFVLWGQFFALVPGLPGKYLRKCYYRLSLPAFSLTSEVGFLSHFSHRDAEVGARVYVGTGATLGTVTIGDGALIGSRVGVLSGKHQHELGPDGRLIHTGPGSLRRVRIGEETWIGEGSLIMADVGDRCIVAAGSVVSVPIPDGSMVGGNPARFVRRVWPTAQPEQKTAQGA
jgi:acetyltransferase-like isoleucine patch superfamily enzyme